MLGGKDEGVSPRGGIFAAYASGFFSLSLVPMTQLAVPLWAVTLGASPFEIGLAVGARSLLPLLFSIHGGILMDRFGTRRVTLFFVVVAVAMAPIYPLTPWISVLMGLQLITGLAQGMAWIGAQTHVAQIARGHAGFASRFSLTTTLGMFVGPFLVGGAWDIFGAAGAFGVITAWAVCLLGTVHLQRSPGEAATDRSGAIGWREMVPKAADYLDAFGLMVHPVIAVIIVVTFLRIAATSIQGSFYPVYLDTIGLPGTAIGGLIGVAALVGAPSSLLAAPALRLLGRVQVLVLGTALSVVAIAATPLFQDARPLLVAAALFGLGLGIGLPLMLSILSKVTPSANQGRAVGLRSTANRLASLVIPIGMGAVVEAAGIAWSFAIFGGLLLAISAVLLVLAGGIDSTIAAQEAAGRRGERKS